MFGFSFLEIALVLLVAFLIFGPEQFPVMLKKIIRFVRTAKSMMANVQNEVLAATREIEDDLNPFSLDDREDVQKDVQKKIAQMRASKEPESKPAQSSPEGSIPVDSSQEQSSSSEGKHDV